MDAALRTTPVQKQRDSEHETAEESDQLLGTLPATGYCLCTRSADRYQDPVAKNLLGNSVWQRPIAVACTWCMIGHLHVVFRDFMFEGDRDSV